MGREEGKGDGESHQIHMSGGRKDWETNNKAM